MRAALIVAFIAAAAAVGSGLTIGVYVWWRGDAVGTDWMIVVVVAHFLLITFYAVMGQSEIEDVITSGILAVCGGLLAVQWPLIGLTAISAALVSGPTNHRLLRWAERRASRAAAPLGSLSFRPTADGDPPRADRPET